MRRVFRVVLSAAFAALIMSAGAGHHGAWAAGAMAPAGAEVKIDNFSFTPQVITVKAGTTITWTNRDDIPHTVVSVDFLFKSKTLDTDDTFQFTPAQPGTYPYFCSIHPKMTGKIIVE